MFSHGLRTKPRFPILESEQWKVIADERMDDANSRTSNLEFDEGTRSHYR